MKNTPNRRASDRKILAGGVIIKINQKDYILNDISREGIGVLVDDTLTFHIGQRIASLYLENHQKAKPLIGIVNHMTRNESGTICGIRFDFRNGSELGYVQKFREALQVG